MPNIRGFLGKLNEQRKDENIRQALKAGGGETFGWLVRRLSNREFGRVLWDDEDWQIAIILDGCRLDAYREAIDKNASWAWSVGSASPEWIGRTFAPRYSDEFADTAYITGNPFSSQPNDRIPQAPIGSIPLASSNLAYLDEVYDDSWGVNINGGYIDVVNPEKMTKRALYAWENRDELGFKRMVVHYMQPHIPFRMYPDWFADRDDLDKFGQADAHVKIEPEDPWIRVRKGQHDKQQFWKAYLDNLEWVWQDGVQTIGNATGANMLVTSDHGNGMGEWGVWSHPIESPAPILRKVPWEHYQFEQQRVDIEPEGPPGGSTRSIDSKLAALGYK